MKLDFKKFIIFISKISIIVLIAKIFAFAIELYLPSSGVYFEKNYNYKPEPIYINIAKIFGINNIKIATKQIQQISYGMNEFILKGLYGNEKKGFIVIAKKSSINKTTIVSLNQIYNGYKLINIKTNYVIFAKNHKKYKLSLNQSKDNFNKNINFTKANFKLSDNFEITKNTIREFIANPKKIWNSIKIVDYKVGKNLKGFRVAWVKNGSFFDKIGIKKGDIIIKANNIDLTSYKAVMDLYAKWEKYNLISLVVKRGNKEKELFYEIY